MTARPTYYVTTPIYYVNDAPHIGHAYTTLACDVLARFKRLDGYDVKFLTGTDEHGLKIFQTAEKETLANPGSPVAPIDICDRYAGMFQALNARLDVSNDFYVRTTQPKHEALAQQMSSGPSTTTMSSSGTTRGGTASARSATSRRRTPR